MSIVSIPSSWQPILTEEFDKPYFQKLQDFLIVERQNQTIKISLEACAPPKRRSVNHTPIQQCRT
jgi:uracil DNA glycosylase